jgi:hypothetical protein
MKSTASPPPSTPAPEATSAALYVASVLSHRLDVPYERVDADCFHLAILHNTHGATIDIRADGDQLVEILLGSSFLPQRHRLRVVALDVHADLADVIATAAISVSAPPARHFTDAAGIHHTPRALALVSNGSAD